MAVRVGLVPGADAKRMVGHGAAAGRGPVGLGRAGRPLERAVGASARPPWAPRLRAIGLLLDRSAAQLIDPWLVEVGDGFVVTALTAMDAARASRISLSREFGAEDLEAALLAERAEHAGRQGRSARDGMT